MDFCMSYHTGMEAFIGFSTLTRQSMKNVYRVSAYHITYQIAHNIIYSICERRMKKTAVILSLTLILVLGTVTPFIKLEYAYAQAAYQQQRLGTTNILKFPDVHLVPEIGNSILLGLQFVLSGNNTTNPVQQGSNTVVAFKNPDYGLNNSTSTLN